jgi:hypothetical protein
MYNLLHIFFLFFSTSVSAIRLTLPSADGNRDIAVVSTQVKSQSDLITWYIQLVNEYLWFGMIVFLFVLFVWIWFKLMTNEAGTDDAKKVLRDGILSAWAGIMIIMLSYTVVRLVINLL